MTLHKILIVSLAAFLALPAAAGPSADALSACLADNTNGKERKELAKWIFAGMAAHPEMQGLSTFTAAMRDESDRFVGALFTRLMTKDCFSQTQEAVKNEGSGTFKIAFGYLGQVAMQELMTNHDVETSLSGWEKYFDRQKFEAMMGAKPAQ